MANSEGQETSDSVNCGSRYKGKEFHHLMQILKKKYIPLYKDLNLISDSDLPKDFIKFYSNYSLKKPFYFANIAKKIIVIFY